MKKTFKKSKNIVDVRSQTKFTEENLKIANSLIVEEAFPQLYGEELPDSFKYIGRHIVEMSDIEWESKFENTQTARAGGANPKYKEIRQDIRDYGFKLKHPPIALRRLKMVLLFL